MINHWLVTGDTHGRFSRIFDAALDKQYPGSIAIIILGDGGVNYYMDVSTKRTKKMLQNSGYTYYFVRGNHEERPENIESMKLVYDSETYNYVYCEPEFPNLKYFKDGEVYLIDGRWTLVIGGAYSVDKWYRLQRGYPYLWFKDEQLTQEEMSAIMTSRKNRHYDLVLTHTCPYSWQPFDLFLSGIDQSTVDNSMERWMEEFKGSITWGMWLFGHFHDDRVVENNVKMLYEKIVHLNDIYKPLE